VIQSLPLVAVQPQPSGASTETVATPPRADTVTAVGLIAYWQDGGVTPVCCSVNVCPAIVAVPDRGDESAFALAVTCTVPEPLPPLPEPIMIHAALLVVVQVQPDSVLTATVLAPPVAGTEAPLGEMEYVHKAPACCTLKV
jgi:hypothetical protein